MGDRLETKEMQARTLSRRALVSGGGLVALAGGTLVVGVTIAGTRPSPSPASPTAGSASPAASPVAAVTLRMTSHLRFEPSDVTIKVGETIMWVNESSMSHTATGDPDQNPVRKTNPEYVTLPEGAEPWGSDVLQPNESYTHAFKTPGEYHYICIPHVLSGMRGTITVEG